MYFDVECLLWMHAFLGEVLSEGMTQHLVSNLV
jgi:hypothetical protein